MRGRWGHREKATPAPFAIAAKSAAPTSKAKTIPDPDQQSRLKEIQQDGWTINYLAYADAPATGVKRVNLVREQPPLDIKLVLDQ